MVSNQWNVRRMCFLFRRHTHTHMILFIWYVNIIKGSKTIICLRIYPSMTTIFSVEKLRKFKSVNLKHYGYAINMYASLICLDVRIFHWDLYKMVLFTASITQDKMRDQQFSYFFPSFFLCKFLPIYFMLIWFVLLNSIHI